MRQSQKESQTFTQNLDTLQSSIDSLKDDISTITNNLHTKVDNSELEKLSTHIETLCPYESLKELYNKVMPAIKGFEENIHQMNKDMDTHQQIIK